MDASEIEKMLREQTEWYRKLLYMFLGVLSAISLVIILIVILVGVINKKVGAVGEQLSALNSRLKRLEGYRSDDRDDE